ncbi:MAG: NAD(P)H-dependent oxidoreductase subunit E [Candidatus Velthaea sp.]
MSVVNGAGPDVGVADWTPGVHRAGHVFDEMLARLEADAAALVAQYEDPGSALLPLAHLYQEHEGYVSPNAIAAIAHRLGLSPAVVESTVSFYTLFYRKPVGKYMLQVCRNLSCLLNGADPLMAHIRERLGIGHLETTADGLISYEEVECLAACDRAPCMQVNLEFFYDLTKESFDGMLAAIRAGTLGVKPLVQTKRPGKTWHVSQETGKKSPGGVGVVDPDNAGGIGDRSGIIMLDRLLAEPHFAQRSNERVLHEPDLTPAPLERSAGESGP